MQGEQGPAALAGRPRRVTLKEVAERAGVSPTTASYVLGGRNDMRISTAATSRVERAAEALGYRPNLTARSLRTSVTGTIGLLSDTLASDGYAGQLISGAAGAARAQGRLLVVAESEGDVVVERLLLRELLDRQVDGVLYASASTRCVQQPSVLTGVPTVLLNCLGDQPGPPAVVPDEHGGGRTAAAALLAAGHRDRIHVVGEPDPSVLAARERMAGIRAELAGAGALLAPTIACAWLPAAAHAAVGAALAGGATPSALICLNDRIALGTYQALQDAGLQVPQDVSVVSFDGSDLASWLRPALTTVALPHRALGRLAVALLTGSPSAGSVHPVAMPLVTGGSVAAPAPPVAPATRGRRPL